MTLAIWQFCACLLLALSIGATIGVFGLAILMMDREGVWSEMAMDTTPSLAQRIRNWWPR